MLFQYYQNTPIYYKLHPLLIGGATQEEVEEEKLRAAKSRLILAMMMIHERAGEDSVASESINRGLYELTPHIAALIPDAHLRADLQKWIDSHIQFEKANGEELEYPDINANLESEYPVLTQLRLDGTTHLNQLLGFFILCEYDVIKLVKYLNDYISNTADRIYTRENFPDSLISLLYTKATNPLSSNGLELTREMIVHGRVPDDSIWKRLVQNLEENPSDYERVEKGGFKIIAQLFIYNGDSEELIELLTEGNLSMKNDTLGIIDAFNTFKMFSSRKIYWFNKLFKQLYELGVFVELIRIDDGLTDLEDDDGDDDGGEMDEVDMDEID